MTKSREERTESYGGTTLPDSYEWYWKVRSSFTTVLPLDEKPPTEHDVGYTHTLLFAFSASPGVKMLLGEKMRGFGKTTFNGVGGKLNPFESARSCMVRETLEEINVRLEPTQLEFVGRVCISVPGQGGESVRIALFTTSIGTEWKEVTMKSQGSEGSEGSEGGLDAGMEVKAQWIDIGTEWEGREREQVLLGKLPEKMRPEHKVYLGWLVGNQTTERREQTATMVFEAKVKFDPQPSQAQLGEGERAENHRTVHSWSFDIHHLPRTHSGP